MGIRPCHLLITLIACSARCCAPWSRLGFVCACGVCAFACGRSSAYCWALGSDGSVRPSRAGPTAVLWGWSCWLAVSARLYCAAARVGHYFVQQDVEFHCHTLKSACPSTLTPQVLSMLHMVSPDVGDKLDLDNGIAERGQASSRSAETKSVGPCPRSTSWAGLGAMLRTKRHGRTDQKHPDDSKLLRPHLRFPVHQQDASVQDECMARTVFRRTKAECSEVQPRLCGNRASAQQVQGRDGFAQPVERVDVDGFLRWPGAPEP